MPPPDATHLAELKQHEAHFLRDAWNYGAHAHDLVSDSIANELMPAEGPLRHILTVRLFAEYASALETYGAWAWSIQARFERGCFLNALFQYQVGDVRALFRSIDKYESVIDLLRLPPVEVLVEAIVKQTRGAPPRPVAEYRGSLERTNGHLKEAAEIYLQDDQVVASAYNKTKHGLPILQDLNHPARFNLMVEEPSHTPRPWRLAWFSSAPADVEKLRSSVRAVGTWLREMASLAHILSETGLLYVPLLESPAQPRATT